MQILILIIYTFLSSSSFALNLTTQIHSIDISYRPGEETLIFLTSGHVAKLSQSKIDNSDILNEIQQNRSWINITLNKNREIVGWTLSPSPYPQESLAQGLGKSIQTYTPSVLGSLEWAKSYFKEGRFNPKESQCYNRAHVWSHDWRKNHKLYSSKIFLFFTRKYIREFDFDWWFHVAPYVHVVVDGNVKERVMDIKYTRGPNIIRTWTNIFLRNNAQCPVVDVYSDYANFPETGYCYLMKVSMYYYQPVDIEMLEVNGIPKSSWIESEVKQAYLEAFDIVL